MPQFILVDTLSEYPRPRRSKRLLNTITIRDILQEWADPEFYSEGVLDLVDYDTESAIPVVRLTLEYSQNAIPVYDYKLRLSDKDIHQLPQDRPSVVWLAGTLAQFESSLRSPDYVVCFTNKLIYERWQFEVGQPWPAELAAFADYEVNAGDTEIILPYSNVIVKSEEVIIDDRPIPLGDTDFPERAYLPTNSPLELKVTLNEPVRVGDKFVIKLTRLNCDCDDGEGPAGPDFVQVQSDWQNTDLDSPAYILNKPTLLAGSLPAGYQTITVPANVLFAVLVIYGNTVFSMGDSPGTNEYADTISVISTLPNSVGLFRKFTTPKTFYIHTTNPITYEFYKLIF